MKAHIEGFGALGVMLATHLEGLGVDITWDDNGDPYQSWKASTGCVLPTGNPVDLYNYDRWMNAWTSEFDTLNWITSFGELGHWCYYHKAPPHHGAKVGIKPEHQVGPITVSNGSSFHLNVQRMVKAGRRRWAANHRHGGKAPVIVAHGAGIAPRYLWGWSARVEVKFSREFRKRLDFLRPSVYGRVHRQLRYIHPVPGTDLYYAGTSLISQRIPKSLDMPGKYEKWLEDLEAITEGHVRVVRMAPKSLIEGWRPTAASEDEPLVAVQDNRIVCRPMSGNGIRHFPELADAVYNALQEVS